MQRDPLSSLNRNHFYNCHPLDLRCYFESKHFFEKFDSAYLINPVQPPILPPKPSLRQQVLGRILQNLSQHDLIGSTYVEQYLHHKYRRNCKASTLRLTAASLVQFLCFLRSSGKNQVEQLSCKDIEAFVEDLQDRGLKPDTVRTRLCALYAFLRYLIENKVLGYELMEHKIRLKLPDRLARAIESQDLNLLLSVIDHTRDRALILLLLRSGMRIGELLNCQLADVDLMQQRILIYQSEKTAVGRVVYYSEDAQAALAAWLRVRNPFKDKLFYSQGRQSLSYEAARCMFNRYLQKAGLQYSGYTLHCLRHSFATELLNARMPLECLRVLLGHTSLEVTRRYARLTDKTREEEYFRAMERILKGDHDEDDQCHC
jgi:integrase/recombinase XerD